MLVGGGSGVAPLMAMLRHKRRTMPELDMRLVYSVRYADDVIYADELGDDAAAHLHARGAGGLVGAHRATSTPSCCASRPTARGSRSCAARTASSRPASGLLLELGMQPTAIRTERFGPYGSRLGVEDRREAAREVIRRFDMGHHWEAAIDPDMPAEIDRLTRELIDAYRRVDLDWLLEHCDPDIEIVQLAELPDTHSYHGRDGFIEALLDWPRHVGRLPHRSPPDLRARRRPLHRARDPQRADAHGRVGNRGGDLLPDALDGRPA